MNEERHTIELRGCSPVPLAHYLKAIGILRLVSEQVDETTQGWWENDVFHMRGPFNRDLLMTFFLDDYSPSPIVGPWGARSGFFPTGKKGDPDSSSSATLAGR